MLERIAARLMRDWMKEWVVLGDNTQRQRIYWLAAIATVVLFAFAIRTYHLDFQSFWRDEVDAVFFARETLPSLLAKFTKVGENGPLYFTILHYWMALVGDSEFALRFFSVMFGVLSVPLTYAAGSRLLGRGTGLMASAIAAVSPYYVWYSQEAKMYALLAALSLLSVYLFLRALEDNRPGMWILFVASSSVSLYIHFFAALILVGEVAIFLVGLQRYRDRIPGFAISFAALTLPYLPLAVWELPMLASPPASPYEFVPLDAVGTTLLFSFSVGFTGGGNVLAATLFTFLLLTASVFAHKKNPTLETGGSRWPVVVLLLYLMVPLVAFYAVSLRYPMFTERYLIIILPAFQVLAGAGLSVILNRSVMLFAACLTLIVIFSWAGIYTLQHTSIKADFRSAARYYEANGKADDAIMVVMPYMRRSFDYYHRSAYRWVEPPYANQGASEEEIEEDLRKATGGVKRLWLFLAEEEFWDQRSLLKGWLDRNGRLLDDKEFTGVKLRYYELPSAGP